MCLWTRDSDPLDKVSWTSVAVRAGPAVHSVGGPQVGPDGWACQTRSSVQELGRTHSVTV